MGNFGAAFGKSQAVLSEETVAERNASKRGEVIELSPIEKRSSGNNFFPLSFVFSLRFSTNY